MLIICDLDGTLIDSAPRHLAVLNDLLRERELPPADEEYLTFKREGRSTRDFLRERYPVTPEERERISREWAARIEEEAYLRLDKWMEKRCAVVETYRAAGCRVIVLSARQNQEWIKRMVQARFPWLGPEDLFIVSPMNAGEAKWQVLKSLGDRGPALLVGDTEADYESTRDTGVMPWMLNTGFRSRAYWNRRGIPSHEDLPAVEELRGGVLFSNADKPEKEISFP